MLEGSIQALTDEVNKLQRRWRRERDARLEAEAIAEQGLRELYEKKEQLQLLGAIAIAANESVSVEEVLRFTTLKVCETSCWSVGHASIASWAGSQKEFVSIGGWSGTGSDHLRLCQLAEEAVHIANEVRLAVQVLSTHKPAWVSDLYNYRRADIAPLARIRSGFAFPVITGDEVTAVLEFFSEQITIPDAFFLQLMAQIGAQLGRVIDRKRTEDQLVHDASHDSLTKLPNRALFIDRLTRAIARDRRLDQTPFAVLFIDLDRFKAVNDGLGHNAGDTLLIQVAIRISAALPLEEPFARYGISPRINHELLARLGGDEFTILLDEPHKPSQAISVADRVLEALALPFRISNHEVYVGASIGIAISTGIYTSPVEVLRDADLAMYRAKLLGGSQYVMYAEGMHAAESKSLQMEANLHRALLNEEFVLHYQPIIELHTAKLIGFEALIRWSGPTSELVYPDQFIGIAEETGLIVPIGAWVLREACSTMRQWQEEFHQEPPLTININLSGRQFAQADLVQQVVTIVSETCIDPRCVSLEITESVTMSDADHTIGILSQLGALGIRFCIDDFGTGFSSLSYLHRFQVQVLKIDRSFVGRIGTDGEGLAIVRTIVSLARHLGIEVVAEGIETEAQLADLTASHCRFGQGVLFSPPLDAASARTLLQAENNFSTLRSKDPSEHTVGRGLKQKYAQRECDGQTIKNELCDVSPSAR